MIDEGKPYVYRFRVPFDRPSKWPRNCFPLREIVVDDLVLGEAPSIKEGVCREVIWNSDDLGGDFVIVRQNGLEAKGFRLI